jgi:hypothetical protein
MERQDYQRKACAWRGLIYCLGRDSSGVAYSKLSLDKILDRIEVGGIRQLKLDDTDS